MSPSDKKELSLSLPQNIVEDPGKPSDKEELPADINKTKAKEKRMSYSQDRNSKRY